MKSRPKIVIKVKKKHLYDEYVLTNKHIICKFKYLFTCFDHQEPGNRMHGLVCLKANRLTELIDEQSIVFDASKEDGYLMSVLEKLREWHPLIDKVDAEINNLYEVEDLTEYPVDQTYLKDFKYNNCVLTTDNFENFRRTKHNVININVYFKLVKKLEKVEDYGVNFNYLHKLLTQCLCELNNEKSIYLDEVTVGLDQLPFASTLDIEVNDEDKYYVYPYVGLFPLYVC
jgi:hypothetical protein